MRRERERRVGETRLTSLIPLRALHSVRAVSLTFHLPSLILGLVRRSSRLSDEDERKGEEHETEGNRKQTTRVSYGKGLGLTLRSVPHLVPLSLILRSLPRHLLTSGPRNEG